MAGLSHATLRSVTDRHSRSAEPYKVLKQKSRQITNPQAAGPAPRAWELPLQTYFHIHTTPTFPAVRISISRERLTPSRSMFALARNGFGTLTRRAYCP